MITSPCCNPVQECDILLFTPSLILLEVCLQSHQMVWNRLKSQVSQPSSETKPSHRLTSQIKDIWTQQNRNFTHLEIVQQHKLNTSETFDQITNLCYSIRKTGELWHHNKASLMCCRFWWVSHIWKPVHLKRRRQKQSEDEGSSTFVDVSDFWNLSKKQSESEGT